MNLVEIRMAEAHDGEVFIHVRRATGGRWAGIWQGSRVCVDATRQPARYFTCHSKAQAISLAHRWCQGYDV